MQLIRSALAAVLAVLAVQAAAQNGLEIIPLRHRLADQVLPALRPLLEPGATLSGQGSQLFVRTSPANLDELRRALEALDRPLRRLQISVRLDQALDAASRSVEASGRISNRGASIDLQGQDNRGSSAERIDQRLQVLEGGRAFIATGRSTPIAPGAMREIATGFEAVPRLSGQTVMLEIVSRRETLNQQQSLSTTVSARLGEWFEVGSAVQSAAGRTAQSASRVVWLKVEEIAP